MESKLRFFVYPAWFSFCFTVSVYLTFPVDLLENQVVQIAEAALGKGDRRKVGRHGVEPKVEIGSLSLYRLTGLSFERLSLQLASNNPDPGPVIDFDEFNVSVGMFGGITGSPTVSFNGRMYEGEFNGEVDIKNAPSVFSLLGDDEKPAKGKQAKPGLDGLEFELEGLRLDRAPVLLEKVGLPLTGTMSAQVNLAPGEDPAKEAEGSIEIQATGLSVGPGERKIPMMGPFTVPLIDMGKLSVSLPIQKGKGKTEICRLKGNDFGGEMELSVSISPNLMSSKLSGDGSFAVEQQFLEKNGKFKTILEFPGPLQKAKDKEGRFHYLVKGNIEKPKFSLSSTGGKKKSKRGRKKGK